MNVEDGLRTMTLAIDGMHCERCVSAVRTSLLSMDGIDFAAVTVGKVEVRFLPQLVSEAEIEQAIADSGYPVRKQAERKGFFKRYIDRIIESNQKNFGNERLDCCNLSSKRR